MRALPKLLLLALLASTARVPGQTETPPPTTPPQETSWLATPLAERKIPTSIDEGRAELARIREAIEALGGMPKQPDAEPSPLVNELGQQAAELESILGRIRRAASLDSRLEEAAKRASEATGRLEALQREWASAEKPSETALEQVSTETLEREESELARLTTLRSDAQSARDGARKAAEELAAAIQQAAANAETARKAAVGALESLEAQKAAGTDPQAISLARERAFLLQIRRARWEAEASHLQVVQEKQVRAREAATAQQEFQNAELAEKIQGAKVEALKAQRRLWKERDAARERASSVESLKARLAEAPPFARPYYEEELRRHELDDLTAKIHNEAARLEARFGAAGDIGRARYDTRVMKRQIELASVQRSSGLAGYARNLRELLDRARQARSLADAALAEMQALYNERYRTQQRIIDDYQDIEAQLARRRDQATALAAPDDRWGPYADALREDWAWKPLEERFVASRTSAQTAVQDLLEALSRVERADDQDRQSGYIPEVEKLRSEAARNVKVLNGRLLWTREESEITTGSLKLAFIDGKRWLGSVPRRLGDALVAAWDMASRPQNRLRSVIGLAVVALLWLGRFWLRRRLMKVESRSDQSPLALRSISTAILKRTSVSTLVALVGVGIPLAIGMPDEYLQPVLIIFLTPVIYRACRVFIDVLADPSSRRRRLLPIPDNVAALAHQGVRLGLVLSVILVPVGLLLETSGYARENPGLMHLWWLSFVLLLGLTLALTILRPKVVFSLVRHRELSPQMKAAVVMVYPFLVCSLAFLFILGGLRYSVAAHAFGAWLLTSTGLLIAGRIVYRFAFDRVLVDLDPNRHLDRDDFEDDDSFLVASRRAFFARLVRLALRIAIFGTVAVFVVRMWPMSPVNLMDDDPEGSFSPAKILWAALAAWITWLASRIAWQLIALVLLPSPPNDRGLQYTAGTLTRYAIIAIGVYVVLRILNVQGDQIAWFVSALALGIGFGLQSIVRNFVSGLILLVDRPINVGDRVTVGDRSGLVEKITLRATTVITWNNIGVVIPNEEMVGGRVINASLGPPTVRTDLPFGVAYGSDVQLVRKVVGEAVGNHGLVLRKPSPEVFFLGFGDSSLDFEVKFWTHLATHRARVSSDIHFAIDAAFRRNGIEVPFPQRDLHLRSVDEGLLGRLQEGADPQGDAEPTPEQGQSPT
jgi:small-conductance mechanosensitive channel